MNFLPLWIDGKKVYAGLWVRVFAKLIDCLMFVPFFAIINVSGNKSKIWLIAVMLTFAVYDLYFNTRWGATPGKMVFGLRITKPDGSPIGFREALKHSAVDIGICCLSGVQTVLTYLHLDFQLYAASTQLQRTEMLKQAQPTWTNMLELFSIAWAAAVILSILLNYRRRDLNDFIAGTVVIFKEFTPRTTDPSPDNQNSDDFNASATEI